MTEDDVKTHMKMTKAELVQALDGANSIIQLQRTQRDDLEEQLKDKTGEMRSLEKSVEHLNGEVEKASRLLGKLQSIVVARLAMLSPAIEEIQQRDMYHQHDRRCDCTVMEVEPPVYISEEVKLLRHLSELMAEPSCQEKIAGLMDSMAFGQRGRLRG